MLILCYFGTLSLSGMNFEGIIEEANNGSLESQKALSLMYFQGKGVIQDYQEAAKWMSLAAKQGDPDAQYSLGLWTLQGMGVQKDESKSRALLSAAVAQGNKKAKLLLDALDEVPSAQFEIYRFLTDNGLDTDFAFFWLEKAIKNGHPDAHYEYGRMYGLGHIGNTHELDPIRGKTQDEWFRKAAWLGSSKGQIYVANGYLYNKEYIEAYAWANLASINNPVAQLTRDQAMRQLNKQQIQEAQALSRKIDSEIKSKSTKN